MTTQTAATHPLNRVAVYCGAATPADPRWVELAREVGDTLARRGIGVVYGGGRRGLMGAVADGALAAGGEVIGVIPDALAEAELAHTGVSQLIQVQTMHERKACFTQLSDGFITLPGGVGTMDELWEAVSWSQLGYHALPVGLLNAYGYYDKLLEFAAHMTAAEFVRPQHAEIILAEATLEALLARMAAHVPVMPLVKMPLDTI